MPPELGTMMRVKASEVWKHEELEFTPWLAHEDNIGQLANALGFVELQVEGVEVPVGPFSADILAKDASERFVVIENQFGKTNHDHLGKILTYAATLDATAVVWLAERFTDEHRKAIEWLNDHTLEDLSLYAVEVELWRIDSSRPAVRFNVLSQPTEIARQGKAIKSGVPKSEAQELQRDFWTIFREQLLERKVVTSAQAARPQYWFNVSLGRSHIHLSCTANTSDGRIGIRVYISNKIADWALPQLEAERQAIETQVGEQLKWNPNPDAVDKTVVSDRPADLHDRAQWQEYISWLIDRVEKFKAAFGPRVRALKAPHSEI